MHPSRMASATLFTRLAAVAGLSIPPTTLLRWGILLRSTMYVEKHLEKEAAASAHGMTRIILRPVTFFENQTLDRHGPGFAQMWEQIGDKKLQLAGLPRQVLQCGVITCGGRIDSTRGSCYFRGCCEGDAGCAVLCWLCVKFFMKEALGTMFQRFRDVGYGADVEECRKMNPQMQDYRIWLKENSSFVKKREYECAACISRRRYISYVDI